MPNICVIPARGGSKRIPDKNIKLFYGRPIIEYSILTARESGYFERIIVTSDSEQIGAVAARAGAVFHKRKADLAGDDVPMVAAVVDVLNHYLMHGEPYTRVCMVYATAPFLTVPMLAAGYEKMCNSEVVMPIYKESARAERQLIRKGDRFMSRYPEYDDAPTNRWITTYQHAAMFFWADTAALIRENTFMLPKMDCVVVPPWAVQEFDIPEDWEAAEIKYEVLRQRAGV